MDSKTRKIKMKSTKPRCLISGKIITGNKEAVLVENAIAYVRKLGYLVSNIKFMFLLVIVFVLLVGFTSPVYSMELNPVYYNNLKYPILEIYNDSNDLLLTAKIIKNTDEALINAYTIYEFNNSIPIEYFSELFFEDDKGKKKILDYNIYYQVENKEDFKKPIFEKVCEYRDIEVNTNGIETIESRYNCYHDFIGYEEEETQKVIYDWKKYKGEIMPVNSWIFKQEVKKEIHQNIDFSFSILNISESEIRKYWAWYNDSWSSQQELTIEGGLINLTDFPVYVEVNYTQTMQNDFDDLRFISGACSEEQTQELSYEFEYINDSVKADIWLKIPNLENTNNNSVCMYYNNSNAGSGEDVYNVWDNNYLGVYHFAENSSFNGYKDSTRNIKNATISSGTQSPLGDFSCRFGRCAYFDGSTGFLIPDGDGMDLDTNNHTLETWLYPTAQGSEHSILSRFTTNAYWWEATRVTQHYFAMNHVNVQTTQGGSMPINQWWYGLWWRKGTVVGLEKDKSFVVGDIMGTFSDVAGDIGLGHDSFGSYFFTGRMDELRISNTTRSSEWRNRSYDNVNKSLFSFGQEVNITPDDPNITDFNYVNESFDIFGDVVRTENLTINATVENADSVWYIIWSGVKNISSPMVMGFFSLVSGNLWSVTIETNMSYPIVEELNYTIYANNTENIINNVSSNITITITTPNVDLLYPLNQSYSSNVSESNYSAVSDTGLDFCWFSYDNGLNNISYQQANQNFTDLISNEGSNIWTIFCNDSSGGENSSEVTFFKDSVNPILEIVFPPNQSNQTVNRIDVNYTFTELNIDSIWYSNDSYQVNYSLNIGENITTVFWNESQHNVTIWINDSLGNINSDTVVFYINTSVPDIPRPNRTDRINTNIQKIEFGYNIEDGFSLDLFRINEISAEMYSMNNNITTNIINQDEYVVVTENMQQKFVSGFYYNNGSLFSNFSGRYSAIGSVVGTGGNNKNFHLTIGINGNPQDNCHRPRSVNANDIGVWAITCSLDLNESDEVNFMVENVQDDSDILISDSSLVLLKIGELNNAV